MRLTRASDSGADLEPVVEAKLPTPGTVSTGIEVDDSPERNEIVAIRRSSGMRSPVPGAATAPTVEIELASTRSFPVSGALPTLVIGSKTFKVSHYPTGATDRLVFTLDATDFAAIGEGAPVSVRVGGARLWDFDKLHK